VRCPKCKIDDTKVIDSREAEEGASIRRRRSCSSCGHRFTTYERLEEVPLLVVKSDGRREPYDRGKLLVGVSAAAKGRPVGPDELEALADDVEDAARSVGSEVSSSEIGRSVLDGLRALDEVAYLRFASVYKNFDDADDFQREVRLLQKERSVSGRARTE
jgi:transcriptional repressor NrdR